MDGDLSKKVIENLLDQIDELKTDGEIPNILDGATYYSCPGIPNPRVVDLYAAEAGILDQLYKVQRVVDVIGNENRNPEMMALNPDGATPFLKLADGTVVAETIAIAELLEGSGIGSTKLFGDTTVEKGLVHMWQRRVEQHIVQNCFDYFRSGPAREMFKERGMHAFATPEIAATKKAAILAGLKWLEDIVSGNEFICLDRITIVDIQLYATLHFILTFDMGAGPPLPDAFEGLTWFPAWYKRMDARPSAAATLPSS